MEKAKNKNENYLATIDTTILNLYRKFLTSCKSGGIEVILVSTPEHIEGQMYVKNRQEIINIFRELAQDYNLLFIDYSDNEICSDTAYFYNASHLNATGADLFTRILTTDLKNSGRIN